MLRSPLDLESKAVFRNHLDLFFLSSLHCILLEKNDWIPLFRFPSTFPPSHFYWFNFTFVSIVNMLLKVKGILGDIQREGLSLPCAFHSVSPPTPCRKPVSLSSGLSSLCCLLQTWAGNVCFLVFSTERILYMLLCNLPFFVESHFLEITFCRFLSTFLAFSNSCMSAPWLSQPMSYAWVFS